MNTSVKDTAFADKIFSVSEKNFTETALALFQFQYANNPVYQRYCQTLHVDVDQVDGIEKIPFVPINFFKTHEVKTTAFETDIVFESSGTTQTINSKHFVKDVSIYEQSFTQAFEIFYGKEYCILALLPSYLERNNSSLVMMADKLIKNSNHPKSGFYLNNLSELNNILQKLEKDQQPTLLLGATFALLDLAEKFPMPLHYTTIMETGGMKGRRKEITRAEVHQILSKSFSVNKIHSEYGMTELLSQAYSKGDGIFNYPPWMKILIREEDDPLFVQSSQDAKTINGAINIIDLANIYSCAFIATEDAGKLFSDESFEILGRLDNSDIRGCSLLTL